MKKIEINKGFNLSLTGMPETSLKQMQSQKTMAVSALDIPFIRPKILVKENESVKTGSPIFCDKRDQSIQYLSPATGKIKEIQFGPRRRLIAVVIECEDQDTFISFEKLTHSDLKKIPTDILVSHLKAGGLWQCFRQFPYKDTANPDQSPPMIIVSLYGNDLFSPVPQVLLNNQHELFEYGLDMLKLFTQHVVVAACEGQLEPLGSVQKHVTHIVPDTFPSWDPGVVLYHIKRSADDNRSWCISVDHLIMMAKLLTTGQYPTEKVLTISKPGESIPHLLVRQGFPLKELVGNIESDHIITTGQFNGRMASIEDYVGFFENTYNIIPAVDSEQMFGFVDPGFNKPTVSKTFLSCLKDTALSVDATLHGEERACINCGYCENICPNDLMPQFIMKALETDEIEDALQMGLLDCCQCGLCSYTCPSKIELAQILSNGKNNYYTTINNS